MERKLVIAKGVDEKGNINAFAGYSVENNTVHALNLFADFYEDEKGQPKANKYLRLTPQGFELYVNGKVKLLTDPAVVRPIIDVIDATNKNGVIDKNGKAVIENLCIYRNTTGLAPWMKLSP